MATEASLSSSSAAGGGTAGLWHYYAAVGNKDAKLATLVELLQTLESTRRPLAICCGSRDALDLVVYTLLQRQSFALTAIHSDLDEKERELALLSFMRGVRGSASQVVAGAPAGGSAAAAGAAGSERAATAGGLTGRDPAAAPAASAPCSGALPDSGITMCVLVISDVCLKALPKELLPVGVSLMVEFDLPPSKEVYVRRVSTLFGGVKERRAQCCVVVDLVEAGGIPAFRALESFVAGPVREVPVRLMDIFAAAAQ